MGAHKAVVFNAVEFEDRLDAEMRQALANNQYQTTWFDLPKMNIHPCRSCGSCGLRTAGQCVIGDDMQPVLRAFASSQVVILITPIRFGGYSSELKKAIDRLLPVGLPYYIVKAGTCCIRCAMDANISSESAYPKTTILQKKSIFKDW
jgi:multimeric flavodoxin WrbA